MFIKKRKINKEVSKNTVDVKKEPKVIKYVSDEKIKEVLREITLEPCIYIPNNPNIFVITKLVHERLGTDTDKARIYEVVLKEIIS